MNDWQALMKGKTFITDLGQERTCEVEGETKTLGRYAVWSPMRGSDSHSIVEIGNHLETLMAKYKIPVQRVCTPVRSNQQNTDVQEKERNLSCQSR